MRKVVYFWLSLLLSACGTEHRPDVVLEKVFSREISLEADSVKLPYLLHPFRWYVQGDKMLILDHKADYFGHMLSLPGMQPVCKFGRQGHGPGEYINPGMVCMANGGQSALFESIPNRMCVYQLEADSMVPVKEMQFPVWMKERSLPKAFSRMWQVKDSMYIGISFPPRFPEVDLLDMGTANIQASLEFPVKGSETAGSYPYLFAATYCNGKLIIAYLYINRIEVYNVLPEGFELDYVIGDGQPQEELSIQDRDDEMIRSYTAVQCDGSRIYALYQGYPDGVFETDDIVSTLEVYQLASGRGEVRLDLGLRIDDIVFDSVCNAVYGYSSLCDSAQFYTFDLSTLN